ncbi:MAG: nitrate reductase catalytic subunit NapA [bacterium]|nr:nitrate reductase catalytic subunit NapA [bacterium]
MRLDRRDFVKGAAMAAASAAAGSEPVMAQALREGSGKIRWDKAPCRFCGTGCHVQVGVEDGKVVAIAGDEAADVNKGLLCVKGYNVGGILYGEDRLTTPLLRKNGRLVPIGWDEALDVVAERITADPAGFAIYGSGQWTIPEGYACQKFIKGGLSNNHIDPNARLCMASAVTGFLATYGVDEPASCYEDLDECDVLILWGNNMAEAHPVLFSRVLDRKHAGGDVRIIDIATRRTRTSDFADEYVEFRPHTDQLILNGIAHILLADGTWDREFVEAHCSFRKNTDPISLFGEAMSFEDYRAAMATFTPESVSEASGVSVEQLRMLAGLFAERELKITSTWCMGVNQHTRGTAVNTMIHAVHLLSGHFGAPGDGPSSLTGQPSACGTVREVGTLAHALPGGRIIANEAHRRSAEQLWNLPEGRINPKPGYHTVAMWNKFCTSTEDGGDVSTIWVQVTNPGQSLPNLEELFFAKAKQPDKFLIVSDVYPTATTELADLVLPSAMWVEKNGIFGNSERRTQQWFKQVEPPGEARDDVWQVIAVAHRLFEAGLEGMRDKDGRFLFEVLDAEGDAVPVWEWERYYDVNVDRALFEEYRAFTRMKHSDLAPYDEYVERRGMRWPVVQDENGEWHETQWRFAEGLDPYVEKDAGVQFYHSTTKDDRAQIWFHPYTPPPESPDGDYPFWLCTGRVLEHWHTSTMTGRVPGLRAAMPGGFVEMNRHDASDQGIQNGDRVVVRSRRGQVELPVWLGGRGEPPRGSVFVPFFDENELINRVTLEATCPVSKQPDFKKCAVQVQKPEVQ